MSQRKRNRDLDNTCDDDDNILDLSSRKNAKLNLKSRANKKNEQKAQSVRDMDKSLSSISPSERDEDEVLNDHLEDEILSIKELMESFENPTSRIPSPTKSKKREREDVECEENGIALPPLKKKHLNKNVPPMGAILKNDSTKQDTTPLPLWTVKNGYSVIVDKASQTSLFKCVVPGCEKHKGFKSEKGYARHFSLNHVPPKFVCTICDKGFQEEKQQSLHSQLHEKGAIKAVKDIIFAMQENDSKNGLAHLVLFIKHILPRHSSKEDDKQDKTHSTAKPSCNNKKKKKKKSRSASDYLNHYNDAAFRMLKFLEEERYGNHPRLRLEYDAVSKNTGKQKKKIYARRSDGDDWNMEAIAAYSRTFFK